MKRMGILLDGRAVAMTIKEEMKAQVALRRKEGKKPPHLCAILVGEDAASQIYVTHKVKDCAEVGFASSLLRFPITVSESVLLRGIADANARPEIDGLIVQLPLPPQVSKNKIIDAIDPSKDVDGFHHLNFGRLGTDLPAHIPATPNGILELLRRYGIRTRGLHAVVVGRSYLVGLPISILLARGSDPGDATVTITNIHTRHLETYTRMADMLITAVGKPGLITGDKVKKGVIAIDVGITRVKDASKKSGYALKGDIDYASVAPKASYITPVPHGVGPMTRAALLMNTLRAADQRIPSTHA